MSSPFDSVTQADASNDRAATTATNTSPPNVASNEPIKTSSMPIVGSVARAIQIVDVLSASPEGLELVAIARAIGMSPSGLHRTLHTLVEGGLVHQPERRGHYQLGPKVLVWAQHMRNESALKAAVEPELALLSAQTNETVTLSVKRHHRIWAISVIEGTGGLVARPAFSEMRYLHSTARGKLFLADMDRDAARAVVAATGLPSLTPNTITDETTLWNVVDQARRDDYATNREETEIGASGIAAPVHDVHGRLIACISIAVPAARFGYDRETELLTHLRLVVERIEKRWNAS